MINIVHLITELNTGGAERMLHRLVSKMDPNKFRSKVVSMTDIGPIGEEIRAEGMAVFTLGMSLGKPTFRGIADLIKFLRGQTVDILQTWLYHADLLGLLAGKAARVENIVWNIRCSDMHLQNYRFLTSLTVRTAGILSRMPDAIVVNSSRGKEIHERRGYYSKKMELIPNGIDTKLFKPDEIARDWLLKELKLPDDVDLIGLVARFDPMKDHRNFVKAASILSKRLKNIHFVLVGDGIAEGNREFINLFNGGLFNGRVHMLGLRSDIPKITAAFDIATSSSYYGEGFSNTIGEAMACGVPCVVTDVGDSAQIVANT
ncbi:glycosyltransferase, partial [Thermodesulfobacteriota bacterium]